MSKELVISAPAHEKRVAILEEGQLVEIYIEREKEFALVGSIYKGRVTRVLPGMQSAFVDIGLDGDAFLYVSDVFENLEDYEGGHGDAHAAAPQPVGQLAPQGEVEGEAHAGAPAEQHPAELVEVAQPRFENDAQPQPGMEAAAGGEEQPNDNRGNYEQQPRQNFQPRPGGDRGRWGRRGRGRSARGPERGRNLPPSKYASPQGGGESRGYDSRGGESRRPDVSRYSPPPASGGEDAIVLPGESLAKYRGRTPATMIPPDEPETQALAAGTRAETLEAGTPAVEMPVPPPRHGRRLPSWLLADSTAEAGAQISSGEAASEESRAEAASQESAESAGQATGERGEENHLTDEHVSALALQLAEAKHEATQEEAEADSMSGGTAFEEENGASTAEEDAEDVAEALGESIGEADEEQETEAESGESHEEETHEEEAHEESGHGHEQHEQEEAVIEAASEDAQPASLSMDLLPGETRSPHGAPMGDRPAFDRPRDSARIGRDPRSRFQRPNRGGGRDRGRFGRRDNRGGSAGGGRPQRFERQPQGQSGGSFRPQHRRPQLISEMLKAGQDIIIQIAKEPLGKKGARITSHVALPGRFLVYMPTIDHIGVSRKIASADNRARLRRLVGEAKGSFPGGFIVRTAAGGATDEEVRADIEFLGKTWSDIKHRSEERKAPALLHRDLNLVERILRDYVSDDYSAIWIDNEEEFGKVVEFVSRFQPKLVNRVKLYTKETPIFEEFGIQHDLDKALRPKVWLKSGGYIVINHTEALVAIDVNTGKYVGKGSTRLEDTIVKTNLEAVKEIVRQIRLRDLGGIIVVDFIDMEERRNREKVLAALQQALDEDKAPSKALSFNEFGLVCITRKRTKQALERVLCQPCPSCSGSGMVKSIPTLCYEIQAEARKMATDHDQPNLTVRVHPEIAKALKTRESMLIDELEQTAHKHVIIQSDATLHWEQYDIY